MTLSLSPYHFLVCFSLTQLDVWIHHIISPLNLHSNDFTPLSIQYSHVSKSTTHENRPPFSCLHTCCFCWVLLGKRKHVTELNLMFVEEFWVALIFTLYFLNNSWPRGPWPFVPLFLFFSTVMETRAAWRGLNSFCLVSLPRWLSHDFLQRLCIIMSDGLIISERQNKFVSV